MSRTDAANAENITVVEEPGEVTLSIHPGVVRRCSISDRAPGSAETTVYEQTRVYNLRGMRPPATHAFRMFDAGGDVGLTFDDPSQRIAKITIELRPAAAHGWAPEQPDRAVSLEFGALTCPPVCPE